MEQADDGNNETQKIQFTGKRKLECFEQNKKKRPKNEFHHHHCQHCECTFWKKHQLNSHVNLVHKCSKCYEFLFTDEVRAQHEIKHEQEEQQEKEKKEQQRQKDDDLALNYLKTNKLDEYQPEPDYEPDYGYIFRNYSIEKEELARFIKKFNISIFYSFEVDDFTSEELIYLLENDAVTIADVNYFLESPFIDKAIVSDLMAYYLDKNYEIKRELVAKVIEDDALIERVKQKYTFTFDEIFKARERDSIFDKEAIDHFYVQVHKHFPNPDFEDPFADPYIDFKHISTEHVHDHLEHRYLYDEENDELSIVVGWNEEREISLGSCKKMLKKNLKYLIKRYNEATEEYDEANEKVSELFDKRDEELQGELTENERLGVLDDYDHLIYKDALPERNYLSNEVSKLYFVIAKK